MLTALYPHHHNLPFWHAPQQPKEIFIPKSHGMRHMTDDDENFLVRESWIWPVLMGLHTSKFPLFMAHISAFYQGPDKKWRFPKRVWIQITNRPLYKDASSGVPIVVRDGKVVVQHLWGGDNRTSSPFGFVDSESSDYDKTETANFWSEFITEKLREAKKEAEEEASETRKAALEAGRRYSFLRINVPD